MLRCYSLPPATLHLGDLAYRAGDLRRARQRCAEVAERAPAWLLALERLLLCHGGRADRVRLAGLIDRRRAVMAAPAGEKPIALVRRL